MNLIFFPDTTPCPDTESQYTDMNGDVGKELKKLSKGDRELLLRVQTTLKKLKTAGNLDIFLIHNGCCRLTDSSNFEFRQREKKAFFEFIVAETHGIL